MFILLGFKHHSVRLCLQASEFFMFSAFMYLDVLIFAIMAYRYKYVDVGKRERERKEEALKVPDQGVHNEAYMEATDL